MAYKIDLHKIKQFDENVSISLARQIDDGPEATQLALKGTTLCRRVDFLERCGHIEVKDEYKQSPAAITTTQSMNAKVSWNLGIELSTLKDKILSRDTNHDGQLTFADIYDEKSRDLELLKEQAAYLFKLKQFVNFDFQAAMGRRTVPDSRMILGASTRDDFDAWVKMHYHPSWDFDTLMQFNKVLTEIKQKLDERIQALEQNPHAAIASYHFDSLTYQDTFMRRYREYLDSQRFLVHSQLSNLPSTTFSKSLIKGDELGFYGTQGFSILETLVDNYHTATQSKAQPGLKLGTVIPNTMSWIGIQFLINSARLSSLGGAMAVGYLLYSNSFKLEGS